MTNQEKANVHYLRTTGLGYGSIAARLNIPKGTVTAYCKRNGVTIQPQPERPEACLHCGGAIEQNLKRKPKKFCSDACCTAWWNSHLELVNRKAYYEITCAHCGMVFQSYGNKNRKYCCHPCYMAARFGKGPKA